MPPRLLDAGAGALVGSAQSIRSTVFRGWQIVRLDIDQSVKPDAVGSITELGKLFPATVFDAIWSSHVLEHLYDHQLPGALDGCFRVLKRDGFAIFTMPDVLQIAKLVVSHGLDSAIYHSAAGPISAIDMLFGHRASITQGRTYMAHHNGFTKERLTRCLMDAGFSQIWCAEGKGYDLWAVALMPEASERKIRAVLSGGPLGFMVA